MATRRRDPSPAADPRTGEPASPLTPHARAATGCPGRPARLSRWSTASSTTQRRRRAGPAAGLLRQPGRQRLGRPRRSVAAAGRGGGSRAGPPPAHRRGRPRGQPAREDRDDRRRRPHRPVPPAYGEHGRRDRARHRPGPGFLLTVHDGGVGPPCAHHSLAGRRDASSSMARTISSGRCRRHRRRLLPVRRPAR